MINDRERTARLNRARDLEAAIGLQQHEMLAVLRDLAVGDDDRARIGRSIEAAAEQERRRVAREVAWDAASLEWELSLAAAAAGDSDALRDLPAVADRLFKAALAA